jgi:hypothetical protein
MSEVKPVLLRLRASTIEMLKAELAVSQAAITISGKELERSGASG